MGYRLDLSHPDGRTATIDAETTNSVEFTHNYSAESEFTAVVPYDVDLLDWELAEVQIYYVFTDGTTLHKFRGEVERVKGNYAQGTMTVYGPGVEHELTKGVADKVITNKTTEQAIKDYYANELSGFSSNVVAPNPETVATDDNVQSADTNSEFDGIISPAATDPIQTKNGYLQPLQVAWFIEGETFGLGGKDTDSAASAGEFEYINYSWNDTVSVNVPYTIPADSVGLAVRIRNPNDPDGDGKYEGYGFDSLVDGYQGPAFADGFRLSDSNYTWFTDDNVTNGDASVSGSTNVKIDGHADNSSQEVTYLDAVVLYDSRFTYTWDNSVDADGWLSGPEEKPDLFKFVLDKADVPYNITEATIQTTVADSETLPEVAVSPDDGSTWKTAADTNSATFTISTATTVLLPRLAFGRYGTRSTQSPTSGFKGHKVDVYDLLLDGNDLGVIEELELTGNHLENLKAIHNTSDYRFVMDHDPNSLTIESFPSDTEKSLPDLTIKNRLPSTDVGGYANKVHVWGAKASDATRPYAVVQDDTEINEVGAEPKPIIAPDLTTVADVKNKARVELTKSVSKRRNAGELEVVAKHPLPGYTYPVDLTGDGTTVKIPLETVDFSAGSGEADGRLSFEDLLGVEIEVAAAKRTTRNISTLL